METGTDTSPTIIEFTDRPDLSVSNSAMEIARRRDAIAPVLREKHQGAWAVVSRDHATRSSARQVRDRIKSRPCWLGAQWAVIRQPDAVVGDEPKHMICARFPSNTEVDQDQLSPKPEDVQFVSDDQISPTF